MQTSAGLTFSPHRMARLFTLLPELKHVVWKNRQSLN